MDSTRQRGELTAARCNMVSLINFPHSTSCGVLEFSAEDDNRLRTSSLCSVRRKRWIV